MSESLTPEQVVERINFSCRSHAEAHRERQATLRDITAAIAAERARLAALEAAGERLDSALEPLLWGRHCLTDDHVAAAEEASANWRQARGGADKEQPQ